MNHILLFLLLLNLSDAMSDTVLSVQGRVEDSTPVANVKLSATPSFKLDSNVIVDKTIFANGINNADIGVIYYLDKSNSCRFYFFNDTTYFNFKHKF